MLLFSLNSRNYKYDVSVFGFFRNSTFQRSTFSVSGSAALTFLLGKIGSLGPYHSCGFLLFTLYGFYNLNLLPTFKNQVSLNSYLDYWYLMKWIRLSGYPGTESPRGCRRWIWLQGPAWFTPIFSVWTAVYNLYLPEFSSCWMSSVLGNWTEFNTKTTNFSFWGKLIESWRPILAYTTLEKHIAMLP